jgi:hypothetical protein
LATSKAVRADDVSGLNIATASFTEDAVTKDVQRVILNNSTDGTMATVGSAGLKVDPSGATSPVSIAGTVNVRPSDGTNPVTKTFDLDSGAGTEYSLGVGLRKAASGGSVEAGTSSDPLRIDPTGTTVQPVSASSLPLPTGAATLAKQPALGTAGTASADVITIQGIASMTKLLVTPDSVALPANQSVNLNQIAGTGVDGNSGNKSAGTLRVVLATDQPALTNKLLVTADPITFASAQAVTQSGTWTVQPGNTANTTAWKVDGSAVTQPVQPVGNGAILSNQQAVTGTAAALATNACRKALIKALAANTINVYVGPSGVTIATGFELAPGESVSLDISNTNLAFVIASTTGASVSWIATN